MWLYKRITRKIKIIKQCAVMNTKKDETQKEHYVPRFYLEKFSSLSPSGKERKIWIFNKITQKYYSSDIKDTATNNYFYDFPIDVLGEDKKKIFDANLQNLESFIAPFYREFEAYISSILELGDRQNYEKRILTQEAKEEWSYILAMQALRTPELRDSLKEAQQKSEDIKQDFLEKEASQRTKQIKANFPELNLFSDEDIKIYLIEQVSKINNDLYTDSLIPITHNDFFNRHIHVLSNTFLKHKWLIGVNQTDIPLYTSDHPVAKIPHIQVGYASDEVEILFPINPNLIFILRDQKHPRSHEGDCLLVDLSEDEIMIYNKAQVYCSNRFVYCQKNKFELAKEICKEEPDFRSGVKNRVKFIKQ